MILTSTVFDPCGGRRDRQMEAYRAKHMLYAVARQNVKTFHFGLRIVSVTVAYLRDKSSNCCR